MSPKSAVYSQEQIADALIKANGYYNFAAKLIGCTRATVIERVNADPALQKIVRDVRAAVIDTAEFMLEQAVVAGQPWAIQFVLKTIGKDRGYVEKHEVEHSGDVTVRQPTQIVFHVLPSRTSEEQAAVVIDATAALEAGGVPVEDRP